MGPHRLIQLLLHSSGQLASIAVGDARRGMGDGQAARLLDLYWSGHPVRSMGGCRLGLDPTGHEEGQEQPNFWMQRRSRGSLPVNMSQHSWFAPGDSDFVVRCLVPDWLSRKLTACKLAAVASKGSSKVLYTECRDGGFISFFITTLRPIHDQWSNTGRPPLCDIGCESGFLTTMGNRLLTFPT